MEVVVDGVPVPNLREKVRVKSEVFAVALPSDNLFGLDARTYSPAIDDGLYVMLRPLSVGPHTVRFHGTSASCTLLGGPFSVEVTHNLTVGPVRLK